MPKINHRDSVFVITLINHIYQLMTILQGNEIMPVCVINHIGLSFLRETFLRRLQAFTVEKEKKSENRFVIQLQEQHKPKGKRHHRMAMAESEWEKSSFFPFLFL